MKETIKRWVLSLVQFVDYTDWIRDTTVSPLPHFSVSVCFPFVFVVSYILNTVNLTEEVIDVKSINMVEQNKLLCEQN